MRGPHWLFGTSSLIVTGGTYSVFPPDEICYREKFDTELISNNTENWKQVPTIFRKVHIFIAEFEVMSVFYQVLPENYNLQILMKSFTYNI